MTRLDGPRAAVRITLTARHLDDGGWLSNRAVREVQSALFDVPCSALVALDLGPLRHIDRRLVQVLALMPAVQNLRFESSDWRTASEYVVELAASLRPDKAAS